MAFQKRFLVLFGRVGLRFIICSLDFFRNPVSDFDTEIRFELDTGLPEIAIDLDFKNLNKRFDGYFKFF
ncbi:hypothetical protein RCL_jg2469.t1 [Rhizophagus clarus]|uniref:SMP-LTD domain-containing protein n=1 Tax=Rhizophagus clarus TaxID=94130 RepID=A0A8H3L4V3_9GLOM|nr:hypothetical protein RCL_jg2469.t1 [Rhizophagus clarus]